MALWLCSGLDRRPIPQADSDRVISDSQALVFVPADPGNLAVGQPVGGLGLMMHNRRRNRVNSTVVRREGSRVTLHVDQSFGNCPKYIQVCV